MGASVTTSRGSCPGGGRKNFLPGLWLKILWTVYLPLGLLKRDVVTPAPRKVHSGKQTAEVAAGREDCCAIRRSFLTHRQVCRERRSRRDRGGATGTVAASRVFTHRTVAAARNRASGFGGDWRVRQQLPVGVGPDDRMPPGQPGAEVGAIKDSQKR